MGGRKMVLLKKKLSQENETRPILNQWKAAELLGCSLTFLKKHTLNGSIPNKRIGRRYFYSRERLVSFIAEKELSNTTAE